MARAKEDWLWDPPVIMLLEEDWLWDPGTL
jgi:hypothetical protein